MSVATTPMLPSGMPAPLTAVPPIAASSRKRPAPSLIHIWLSAASLATYTSSHPSPLKSAATTPSAGPSAAAMPAGSVTSSKVPSPRLRSSRSGSGGYAFGPQ